jgi:hypothetical protein
MIEAIQKSWRPAMRRPFLALAAVALSSALTMAACSSGSSTTPEPATPTAGPSIGSLADLVALLPAEVGGLTLQTMSISGDQIAATGGGSPETAALFEKLDADPADVGMAMGFGSDESGTTLSVLAFRVAGADAAHVLDVMRDLVYGSRDIPVVFTESTVAGKSVFRAAEPEVNNEIVYLYATGDLLFVVTGTSPDLSESALALLP